MSMQHVTPPITAHSEYLRVLKCYYDLIGYLNDTKGHDQWDNPNSVDVDFLLSKMEDLLEDARLEVSRRRTEMAKIIGLRWLVESLDDKSPVRGRLTSASPDCKENPTLPHPVKDPEKFQEVMAWMGIEGKTENFNTLRINWPQICELANQHIREGKKIPDCIRSKHVSYTLRHTPRKESKTGKSIDLSDSKQVTSLLRE